MNPLILIQLADRIAGRLIAAPSVSVASADKPVIRDVVKEVVVNDPVMINELNAEKPIQSRVLWGNFIAGVGTILAGILPLLVALGVMSQEDSQQILNGWAVIVQAGGAVVAIGGILYSAYGRLASGLKPLFSKTTA